MHNKIGVAVGITMIAVAGFVFTQTLNLPPRSLSGDVTWPPKSLPSSESSFGCEPTETTCTGISGAVFCCAADETCDPEGQTCVGPSSLSSSVFVCSAKTDEFTPVYGEWAASTKTAAKAKAKYAANQVCKFQWVPNVPFCDEGCSGTKITKGFVLETENCNQLPNKAWYCRVDGKCVATRACTISGS